MSNCSCIYVDVDGGDVAEFHTSKIVKARKPHICNECGEDILQNDEYERVTAKWDNVETIKTCRNCLSIRNEFFCYGYLYGQLWGDLYCHIQDVGGNVSSECLMRLTNRAREKTLEMIESVWKESSDDDL